MTPDLEIRTTSDIKIDEVSWNTDRDLDHDEWLQYGTRLGALGRSIGWWIGDWLSYGHRKWEERYDEASEVTGYDKQTLMNYVYVATRIPPERRRSELTWSHHAEVAPLAARQQEKLLERAVTKSLSVRALRAEIEWRAKPRKALTDESSDTDSDSTELTNTALTNTEATNPLALSAPMSVTISIQGANGRFTDRTYSGYEAIILADDFLTQFLSRVAKSALRGREYTHVIKLKVGSDQVDSDQ